MKIPFVVSRPDDDPAPKVGVSSDGGGTRKDGLGNGWTRHSRAAAVLVAGAERRQVEHEAKTVVEALRVAASQALDGCDAVGRNWYGVPTPAMASIDDG